MQIDRDTAETLGALFARAGYRRVEPAILQPAEPFLDLSGEDIRSRMFLTSDGSGREMCLRPEYTIPVCRDYLAAGLAGSPAQYSYVGPVFRHRTHDSGEFLQAGVESLGREDRAAADAEVFALTLEAAALLGLPDPILRCGDMGLTVAILAALGVSPGEQRRFLRALVGGRGVDYLARAADSDAEAGTDAADRERAALLARVAEAAPEAARALVLEALAIAGAGQAGGRTPAEIAARFLAKAAGGGNGMDARARAVLASYLNIAGDLDEAAVAVRLLAQSHGLALDEALDRFEERNGFIALRGVDMRRIAFVGGFARNLDYYTGFVFELRDPRRGDDKPVGGGGRYDALLGRLGAPRPLPAVGASLWLDRVGTSGTLGGRDA